MATAKLAYTEHQKIINYDTGETIEEMTSQATVKEQEPPYIKLYLEHVVMIYKLPKASSDLLLALAQRVTYDNVIQINKWLKIRIAEELGIKEQSISNALTKFIKKGVIRRVGGGTYQLNPNIFAKGAWKDIKAMRSSWLKLTVTYDENGIPSVNEEVTRELKSA